jgi:hypothetical protein
MIMAAQQLSDGNSTGVTLGKSASDLVSLYGATPVSQRASAVQAASLVSANSWTSVTSNQAAFNAEVAATLTALSVWKGGA